jgi:hypothetical protein
MAAIPSPPRRAGVVKATALGVGSATPVGTQTTIANATGGSTVDAEARAAVNAVIARLKTFGLIA